MAFVPKVRVASSLASEVEETAEAAAEAPAEAAETPALEEPEFDTFSIYVDVGNISFGEFCNDAPYYFALSLFLLT